MSLRKRLRDLGQLLRDLPDMRPCAACGGRRSGRGCDGPARCIRYAADGTKRVGTFLKLDADFCTVCGRVLDENGRGIGMPRGEGPTFHLVERGARRQPA